MALLATACGAVVLIRHEMWRDELQAWSLARESTSIADLLSTMSYEGHPPLWHVLLFGLSRLSDDPRTMQALHLLVAVSAVAVVLRFAPFPKWQRMAFAFGYYPAYEYLAISRPYALGMLLVFLACALGTRPNVRWISLGLCLGLLTLTTVFGAMLSVALGVAFLTRHRLALWHGSARDRRGAAVGATLTGLCLVGAALQVTPPGGAGTAGSWTLGLQPARVLAVFAGAGKAFFPLPAPSGQWLSSIFDVVPTGRWLAAGLALSLIVAVGWRTRSSPDALVLWSTANVLLLAFSYLRLIGTFRHLGALFVALVATLWLASSPTVHGEGRDRGLTRWLLGPLLATHVVAGVIVYAADVRQPFSNAPAVAAQLQGVVSPQTVIVGNVDYAASAVAGLLQHPIYYPMSGRDSTFIIWDGDRPCRTPPQCLPVDELIASARSRGQAESEPTVLLVLNYSISDARALLVASFEGAIVRDENFWVYRLPAD